jgi:cobalt/nickel transport system permease protein
MSAVPPCLCLPWAVHISDGVLSGPWLLGGFLVAGLLALLAAQRVRDEEIPRIAVLSAAFFVASLMHVRLGPTSVHLLLNGLVGVVLGRRAPLAILVGLGLQAVLLGHGGFTTVGVNACVMTLPALLAAGLFALSKRLPWMSGPQTPGGRTVRRVLTWAVGCGIGMTAVLTTLVLNALVLLWGGAEDWHQIVALVFLAHLPIVVIEGVVLGFTVNFLARVKPEMLGIPAEASARWRLPEREPLPNGDTGVTRPPAEITSPPPALLLAVVTTLLAAGTAHAHRLDAGFEVLPDKQVRIEAWFDLTDKPPKGARVQVFRPGRRLLVEGRLDDRGQFVFDYPEVEPLAVVVSAGAGHEKSFTIPAADLEQVHPPGGDGDPLPPSPGTNRLSTGIDRSAQWRERLKDALIGISFLLAVAAFVLSWRNGRRLKALQQGAGPPPA